MAKWHGKIGYAKIVETSVGVHEEQIITYEYRGDLNRNTRRLQGSNELNDNIVVANEISIVADPFARDNFHNIRYVEFMGVNWKVSNVEVQYPRLILTLGGKYNEQKST